MIPWGIAAGLAAAMALAGMAVWYAGFQPRIRRCRMICPTGLYTIIKCTEEDTDFEQRLLAVLEQVRWMDAALLKRIYVVHWDVSEEQLARIRQICASYTDVICCSRMEFLKQMEKQF